MKMTWFAFLSLSLFLVPVLSSICPDSCVCDTTSDGLHRATCSDLIALYKFTLRQKHHNINILNLSHNNITKVNHELDRLTEVVTLDLSTNGITEINKFLHNAKKLVHLNLSNNRLQKLSLTFLPTSVSSLDLTNNMLEDVPSDIRHLASLEHIQLEGNPLICSCENIIARDKLIIAKVVIDGVKCAAPMKLKGKSWLELKTKDVCKSFFEDLDIMMGDQPIDPSAITQDSESLKSVPAVDLGTAISAQKDTDDDDSAQFMRVGSVTSSAILNDIEGSGDAESTAIPELAQSEKHFPSVELTKDEILPAEEYTTDDPDEGSGEGSGFAPIWADYDARETEIETTTPVFKELNPGPVHKLFDDEEEINTTSTEFPLPIPPSVYQGGPDWHSQTEAPIVTEKAIIVQVTPDTTISEQIRVTQASTIQVSTISEKITPHKAGTYVCIAIIVVILVGLIGFAIVKGQIRKRRDRRILRQQKRDVEKASKEMVDMNKSLLGKPAVIDAPLQKKVNGNYELVPTHETPLKKSENIGNGVKLENGIKNDSPRDTNQNRNSSKDNNLKEAEEPRPETSLESSSGSRDSRKETNSLSSEDIFVPLNDEDSPKVNGNVDSDISQPLINGDQLTDSDFLSPSREYVPVYSPDMGRVRIKLSETPKPKTPVLVTRSRSNAGDIIITPALDTNARKSTNT